MLYNLAQACNIRYRSHLGEDCTCGKCTSNNCQECLKKIHFPDETTSSQIYNCKRMMDFYICKYACRYTSELIFAFSQLEDLMRKEHLNILSVGCGPCTDLYALNYLKEQDKYHFNTIEYRGIEMNTDVWSEIYEDLKKMIPSNWTFKIEPENIYSFIDTLKQQEWKPFNCSSICII